MLCYELINRDLIAANRDIFMTFKGLSNISMIAILAATTSLSFAASAQVGSSAAGFQPAPSAPLTPAPTLNIPGTTDWTVNPKTGIATHGGNAPLKPITGFQPAPSAPLTPAPLQPIVRQPIEPYSPPLVPIVSNMPTPVETVDGTEINPTNTFNPKLGIKGDPYPAPAQLPKPIVKRSIEPYLPMEQRKPRPISRPPIAPAPVPSGIDN